MTETGYFAAGCFWGAEQDFGTVLGVVETEAGYAGGAIANPTYEQVCNQATGHAEAVKVVFDPAQVSYDDLLARFWKMHDPTQINRQGAGHGDQYRSAIFATNATQLAQAKASLKAEDASGNHKRPIATRIEPLDQWWAGEDYHQQYFAKRGGGTCAIPPHTERAV